MAGPGNQWEFGKGLGACRRVWQGLLNKQKLSVYIELNQSIQAHRYALLIKYQPDKDIYFSL